jgi:hypothetical protein
MGLLSVDLIAGHHRIEVVEQPGLLKQQVAAWLVAPVNTAIGSRPRNVVSVLAISG